MSVSTDIVLKPKRNWGVLLVRILTWLSVIYALLMPIPVGFTISWDAYYLLFGPVVALDLAAIIGFIVCRVRRQKISFVYILMALAVLVGLWYVTYFELRLRWYEI